MSVQVRIAAPRAAMRVGELGRVAAERVHRRRLDVEAAVLADRRRDRSAPSRRRRARSVSPSPASIVRAAARLDRREIVA